ncbi:hypothetical protein B0H14DRAFT_2996387 [Mycena olivaceomarginata]|nr:hypothetical protein B0H14DRAFT_2996387 [Mycena olivaceomarginata]
MSDSDPGTCTGLCPPSPTPSSLTWIVVRAHGLPSHAPRKVLETYRARLSLIRLNLHETTLGSDGQNINLKDSFHLRHASLASQIEIKVFYRAKKRNLVGCASCSLGEMWKKHGKEPKLRLQCQNPTNRSVRSRGRPQNGALIHLKLPNESDTLPPLPLRRRVRGYCINSDEEPDSFSETDDEDDDSKALLDDPSFINDEDEEPPAPIKISFNPMEWIAGSNRDPIFFERVISSFTVYSEMKHARCHDDFDRIFTRLQLEWTYTAGILVALAAVDTAVFSISPDSIFAVNPLARGAVAASSIASGLGITCATWCLVRYAWVNLEIFLARAEDILSTDTPSYFFFALTARIPSLLMLASAVSLMFFMAIVAWFLVFSILWVVKSVRKLFRFLVCIFIREKDCEKAEMNEKQ